MSARSLFPSTLRGFMDRCLIGRPTSSAAGGTRMERVARKTAAPER